MTIPVMFNVLDQHGGFTALVPTGSLWRPGRMLRKGSIGTLQRTEHKFWQRHDTAILAYYKVPGYRYLIGVWFCPFTGRRLDGSTVFQPTPDGAVCQCGAA